MRPQKRPGILIRVIPEGVASYVLVVPKRCSSHPPGADSGGGLNAARPNVAVQSHHMGQSFRLVFRYHFLNQ